MTGAALAADLIDRGLDPGEWTAKASLFDLVLAGFGALGRGTARHVWWIPGRLEVFGKHTDYAGGRTLVAAVPRGLAVLAEARSDGILHIVDARRGESMTLQPAGALPGDAGEPSQQISSSSGDFTGWRHYVEVVARRLARNFPGANLGADVVLASDLPRAAGMSSSSALVVGVAAALVRVSGIETRAEWQANIHQTLDAAGYYACLENGLSFGTLAGDAGVGTHGGSEDHAAILAGIAGHLSAFSFVPMRAIGIARVPDDWRFVLAPSGVRAEKTGAAKDSYNQLARGTQALLEIWNSAGPHASSLASALGAREIGSIGSPDSAADAVQRLRDLARRSSVAGLPADTLVRRLDHFVREDARVAEAFDAFHHGDAATLTRLSADSQADAEALLGNQIPETVALAKSAAYLGAFAASSFGAGFGGSVWALVGRSAADRFTGRWHPEAFVAPPGPPLTELSN